MSQLSAQISPSPVAAAELPLQSTDPSDLRAVWVKVGILVGLVAAIYWSSLWRLWSKTNPIYGEGNWQHSMIVPLVGLYYLYLNRDELLRTRVSPILPHQFGGFRLFSALALIAGGAASSWVVPQIAGSLGPYLAVAGRGIMFLGVLVLLLNWGVGTLLFGLLTFAYGIYPGQNDYVKDLGLVITIFGIVLTMCGWKVMKIAWFPIAFLVCALPWPGLVYSKLATPLQNLAAMVAVFVLQLTGVDAIQSGTKIIMDFGPTKPSRMLNVAEACAGLRSLMTFITLGAAIAFLSNRPLWQKFLITAFAIPIAVLCNVMRVSGQGIIDSMGYHEFAEGFAHQFVGLVMLIPAIFMLLGVAWVVDHLFVEEVDAKALATAKPAAKATKVKRRVVKSTPAAAASGGGEHGH